MARSTYHLHTNDCYPLPYHNQIYKIIEIHLDSTCIGSDVRIPSAHPAPPHDDPLNQRHTSHPSRRSDSRTWVTGSRLHYFGYSFLVRDVPCLGVVDRLARMPHLSRRTDWFFVAKQYCVLGTFTIFERIGTRCCRLFVLPVCLSRGLLWQVTSQQQKTITFS